MPDNLIAPERLRAGDCVHIVAPSGPIDAEQFKLGLACLQAHDLQAVYDPNLFARDAYLAGSDQHRLQILANALADPDCRAIWCARGGYGATRLLPLIATDQIAQRKPWLIGFSDVSALHVLWQQCGLQSLHGANISGLNRWSEQARNDLFSYLFDGVLTPLKGRVLIPGEPVCAPVMGGNLAVLASLAGTPYAPSFNGAIVFLEDVAERPYRLDRYLTQLSQSGAFNGVRGFALGQFTHCVDPAQQDHGRSAIDVLGQQLATFNVPVLANLAIGHQHNAHALALGAYALLDSAQQELSFD